MKSAKETYQELAAKMATQPGVAQAKMFGMPSIKVNGNAFAGLFGDDMVFKLTGDARDRALAIGGAHLFEPMAGRPMKEWVQVPQKSAKEWPKLAAAAKEYCGTLKKK